MNGPRKAPQPIPYQGSKRRIAEKILRYFPRDVSRLVEPFAGSAAVSIAAAARGWAGRFWINDGNRPLIALWREIIGRPEDIAKRYEKLWNDQLGREREFFDQVRARFNRSHDSADFLYLLSRCVKAAVRYNGRGEFNNTPDNRRKGARPDGMRRRIRLAADLLFGRSRLSAWDYSKVLSQCTRQDLVYLDPPYQGVSGIGMNASGASGGRDSRYLPKVDHDQFCQELDKLSRRSIKFIVSYDGRTGARAFGHPLPRSLGLLQLEIRAGRSAQATLLGRNEITYESLYLSPALAESMDCDRQFSECTPSSNNGKAAPIRQGR